MENQFTRRQQESAEMSRRGSRSADFVLPVLIVLTAALGLARPSAAASVSLTSFTMDSPRLVNEIVDLTARLALAEQEGPGTYDIVLRWGTEREQTPLWIGALVLQRLPSVTSNASLSVEAGDDCAAGIGSLKGSCTLRATVHQAASAVVLRLASFEFAYRWIPEPGFEICLGPGYEGCVEAGQSAGVLGALADETGAAFISTTTLGLPGVRPIPEPTTALLIASGLGLLASRRSVGSTRPAPRR